LREIIQYEQDIGSFTGIFYPYLRFKLIKQSLFKVRWNFGGEMVEPNKHTTIKNDDIFKIR
jgi:hypothetical protein